MNTLQKTIDAGKIMEFWAEASPREKACTCAMLAAPVIPVLFDKATDFAERVMQNGYSMTFSYGKLKFDLTPGKAKKEKLPKKTKRQ